MCGCGGVGTSPLNEALTSISKGYNAYLKKRNQVMNTALKVSHQNRAIFGKIINGGNSRFFLENHYIVDRQAFSQINSQGREGEKVYL